MDILFHRRLPPRWSLAGAVAFACAIATAPGQTCFGLGSAPVAPAWERSPAALGCTGAPQWPAWHLFTPAHRAPTPLPGWNPGNAVALPRVIVVWRCTGFLLVPAVVDRIRTMGYVVDQPAFACAPDSITP